MAAVRKLNDDCLREIFGYCNFNDHIALAQAYEPFKAIVQQMYNHNLDTLLIKKDSFVLEIRKSYEIQRGLKNFEYCLQLLHRFVRKAAIDGAYKDVCSIINKFEFAETTELSLKNFNGSIADTCFPKLHSLEIIGGSVVKFKPQWSGVKNLTISAPFMSDSQMIEILSQMKLKTLKVYNWVKDLPSTAYEFLSDLEELTAQPQVMPHFYNALESMIKLKKLSIENNRLEYLEDLGTLPATLLTKLGTRIVEIYSSLQLIHFEKLSQLCKIRNITLYCTDIDEIKSIPSNLPLQKAIEIILLFNDVTAEILTEILISQHQLEFLHLMECYSDSKSIYLDVMKIAKHRTIPISINLDFQGCKADEFDIVLSAPTDLIKITNIPQAKRYCAYMTFILE